MGALNLTDPLTPVDLFRELMSIVCVLEDAGIDYAVCGGLALAVHGHPRMTKDIDLLVREADLPAIKNAVAPLGYEHEAEFMIFRKGTERETRVHRIGKVVGKEFLTLVLVLREPGMGHLASMVTRIELEGHSVRVVSREALKLMTQHAGRSQDRVDMEALDADEQSQETTEKPEGRHVAGGG